MVKKSDIFCKLSKYLCHAHISVPIADYIARLGKIYKPY